MRRKKKKVKKKDKKDKKDKGEKKTENKEEKKKKKKKIPEILKFTVWDFYIGKDKGESKCLCCNVIDIHQSNHECGHVESENNGGKTVKENLRPICSKCNKSMGTTNMLIFMNQYGYKIPDNFYGKK